MLYIMKSRWVLFTVLILFITFKIPHLFYPYYWDESWPYAPAITEMYHHGISLMPGAIDTNLSRGHPLFFHAIGALWMKIFGASHPSMHSFALTISVFFLVAIYEAGLRLFNQRVAILALLLAATQALFFVQSSFVLFEMLIAFLAFLSLYFYTTNRYLPTALCLAALFLTKESGLIMGFVLGIDALIRFFSKDDDLQIKLKRIASVGFACICVGVFFLLQKRLMGWYILPLYNDLIEHNWDHFWGAFRLCCVYATFIEDYRFYYFFLLLVLSVFAAAYKKQYGIAMIIVPAVFIYIIINPSLSQYEEQSQRTFAAFIVSFLLFLYFIGRGKLFSTPQLRFIRLGVCFIFCFLIFSALNFFTVRYLLAAIVPLLFITAVLIDKFTAIMNRGLYFPAVIIVLGISCYAFMNDKGNGDADLAAFDNMRLQQSAVDYLEQHKLYDKNIGSGSYLLREHLIDTATGFLRNGKTFTNVKWTINDSTDFIVVDDLEPDSRYADIKKDTGFKRVFRNQNSYNWAEIYERRK